jgi:hypothetical protein
MSLVGSFVGGLGKKKDDKDASAPEEEKKGSEEAKDGKGGDNSKSRYLIFLSNANGSNSFLAYLVRSVL